MKTLITDVTTARRISLYPQIKPESLIGKTNSGYFDMSRGDSGSKPSTFLNDDGNVLEYKNHVKQIEAIMDEELSPLGIKFDAGEILKKSDSILRGNRWVRDFIRGNTKGKIWPTQVITTIDILKKIYENPGKSGICVGATMCGKTGTTNNCNWIPLVLTMLTGQPHIIITLLPNSKTLADQTNTERASFLAFYGDAEIISAQHKVSLNRYFTEVISDKFPASLLNPSDPEGYSNKSKSNVVRRTPGERRTEEIIRLANELGIRIIFIVDESHYGAEINSVMAKMLSQAEVVNNLGIPWWTQHIMVGFSATPWEYMNLENVWEVRHKLAYNGETSYVGFNFINGLPIDPAAKVLKPHVLSLGEFTDKFPEAFTGTIGDLEMVVPGWYKSSKIFEEARKSQSRNRSSFERKESIFSKLPESWEDYKDMCHRVIADVLNFCLLKKPHGGRGAALRFVNDNSIMEVGGQWYNGVKQYLDPSINIMHYIAGTNDNAVEKQINLLPKDEPYAVVVTGKGRMGDLFPTEVKYGIELARKIELTPLLQGLVGRMTGHNKNKPENGGGFIDNLPLIILSQKPYEVMHGNRFHEGYIKTLGKAVVRPNNRVEIGIVKSDSKSKKDPRGAPGVHITLWSSDFMKDAYLKKVADRIQDEIVSRLKFNKSWRAMRSPTLEKLFAKVAYSSDGRYYRNFVPLWDILTDEVMDYIERNYEEIRGEKYSVGRLKFLRRGMYDEKGGRFYEFM